MLRAQAGERPAAALDAAHAAFHRTLEGLRRMRRLLDGGVAPDGPVPLPDELARLRAVADECGASLTVGEEVMGSERLAAGLLRSAFRTAEALLRFTAGRHADVLLDCDHSTLRVTVTSDCPPSAWSRPDPQLERARERLRCFDGRLAVTASDRGGSQATAQLPHG